MTLKGKAITSSFHQIQGRRETGKTCHQASLKAIRRTRKKPKKAFEKRLEKHSKKKLKIEKKAKEKVYSCGVVGMGCESFASLCFRDTKTFFRPGEGAEKSLPFTPGGRRESGGRGAGKWLKTGPANGLVSDRKSDNESEQNGTASN